jgi:hypothetical protein
MSLGIVGLTSLLAALLMVQGLRADRNAQLVLDRQHQLEAQSRAFSELASQAALFDPEDEASLAKLTKIACEAAGVRRVSLWTRTGGGQVLLCDDCYDRESDGHTQGARLMRYDLSPVFEALDQGGEVAVIKADDDPRTAELHRLYLHPFGCEALLAASIMHQGVSVGSIWFEDERRAADWSPESLTFARAIAAMLALRLTADVGAGERVTASATAETLEDVASPVTMERGAAPVAGSSVAPHPAMRSTAIAPDRAMVFMARLAARGLDQADMGTQVFADSTVLVVQLTDPLALAERPHAESARSMADHLVCTLEDLAAANGIEYLKIMSDESESTYQRMRDRFLFSVRGAYYLQEVGELSTYILTGRI